MAGEQAKVDMAERAMRSLELAQAAEPELTKGAKELMTLNGIMNRIDKLHENAAAGGGRDEIAAMNCEHKTLALALKALSDLIGHSIAAENGRRLGRIEEQLGRRDGGGSTSFNGFEPPEAPNQGAN